MKKISKGGIVWRTHLSHCVNAQGGWVVVMKSNYREISGLPSVTKKLVRSMKKLKHITSLLYVPRTIKTHRPLSPNSFKSCKHFSTKVFLKVFFFAKIVGTKSIFFLINCVTFFVLYQKYLTISNYQLVPFDIKELYWDFKIIILPRPNNKYASMYRYFVQDVYYRYQWFTWLMTDYLMVLYLRV